MRRISLTQQIIIGLVLGIVAGALVSHFDASPPWWSPKWEGELKEASAEELKAAHVRDEL